MSIENLYTVIYSFLITNQLIAFGIAVGLGLFLWKKPGEFFKLILILLALLAGFYILSIMSQSLSTGEAKKHEMTTEREERLFGD
jgi:chromate transport protein ChrA